MWSVTDFQNRFICATAFLVSDADEAKDDRPITPDELVKFLAATRWTIPERPMRGGGTNWLRCFHRELYTPRAMMRPWLSKIENADNLYMREGDMLEVRT